MGNGAPSEFAIRFKLHDIDKINPWESLESDRYIGSDPTGREP